MEICEYSENILLVKLFSEPDMSSELSTLIQSIRRKAEKHVVINFSSATVIKTKSITWLLKLHKILDDEKKQLFLTNIALATMGTFKATGLDKFFQFSETWENAVAMLSS